MTGTSAAFVDVNALEAQLATKMTLVPLGGRLVRVYAHALQQRRFAACVCDFSSRHIVRVVVDLDGQRFDNQIKRLIESTVACLIALVKMRAGRAL